MASRVQQEDLGVKKSKAHQLHTCSGCNARGRSLTPKCSFNEREVGRNGNRTSERLGGSEKTKEIERGRNSREDLKKTFQYGTEGQKNSFSRQGTLNGGGKQRKTLPRGYEKYINQKKSRRKSKSGKVGTAKEEKKSRGKKEGQHHKA